MKPLARIRLRLLGRLALAHEDNPAPIRLSTRKAGAVLAYVALSPEQTASREQLATLLWGGCSDQQARQSLRQALVLLRKELGDANTIFADSAVIRIQPGRWIVDALDFEELSKSTKAEDLDRAGALFGGEFLSGLNIEEEGFGAWVREQRERVQLAAARLCETFATRPDLVRDGEQAIAATERLLALDPLREDWHRYALVLYARYRGRSEALAQGDALAALLRRELDVSPEKETQALIERIRAGEIAPVAGRSTCEAPPVPESIANPESSGSNEVAQAEATAATPVRWPLHAAGAVAAAVAVVVGLSMAIQPDASGHPKKSGGRDPAVTAAVQENGRHAVSAVGGAASRPDSWQSPPLPSQHSRASADTASRPIIALAVLPFSTFGESQGSERLTADIITDDLTNGLSRVPMLRVISRQTMRAYATAKVDVAALGSELGVRYVLEGNVRLHGEKLRVNAELINPATRLPIWSVRIEREKGDQDGVRDEIVGRLARELQFEVYRAEGTQGSNNPAFRRLIYIGSSAILSHGTEGFDALKRAEAAFLQADAINPGNQATQFGLAAYYTLIGSLQLVPDWREMVTKAEQLLRRNLKQQGDVSAQYFYLSLVLRMRGDLDGASDALQRCIELAPSTAPCHAHLGHTLVQMGQPKDGIEHIAYALRLSPRDRSRPHWLRFAGEAEIEMENYARAVTLLEQSYSVNRRYPYLLRSLAAASALSGKTGDAGKYLAELRSVAPHFSIERYLARPEPLASMQPVLSRGLRLALKPTDGPGEPAQPGGNPIPGPGLPLARE